MGSGLPTFECAAPVVTVVNGLLRSGYPTWWVGNIGLTLQVGLLRLAKRPTCTFSAEARRLQLTALSFSQPLVV